MLSRFVVGSALERTAKGCPMNRADTLDAGVATQQNPMTEVIGDSLEQRREATTTSAAKPVPRVISAPVTQRLASPVRLTLASRLGSEIDGAWWPRTGLISRELPELISVLDVRLGRIFDINVNWSSLQCPPDLNCLGWGAPHQRVMTVGGRNAQANLLIVPHRTGVALAIMVLRQAAGLPIAPSHRDSRAFQIADRIVRVARGEMT
jgi:Family of unknown function (DUF5994)